VADDQVSVEILAKIDGLTSGLTEAVNAMHAAVTAIQGDTHELEETSKETESVLKEMLSGENFIVMREKAEMALEAIKGAFEGTVGAAEEFGLSTQKFADQMGISQEKAAGLQAALTNVGSSTETYETIALRLEKSLRSTGGASAELKDQFKDANGEFLTGAPLMERLKEVTDSYASGSARTSVEIALLGRQTKSYYDIARVTADDVERQTGIYKQMGVDFSTLTERSRELEDAEGDLRTAWQAETVVIGQQLMPVAQAAIRWMGGEGKELIGSAEVAVKALMTGFAALKTAVVEAVIGATGALATLWESLKLGGKIIEDVTTGNVGSISEDWEEGAKKVGDAWSATGRAMASEFGDFDKTMSSLWDHQQEKIDETKGKASAGRAAPEKLTAGPKGPADHSAEEGIKEEEKLSLAKISTEESTNAHLLAMGQRRVDAAIAEETQLENAKYTIQNRALEKELQLGSLSAAQRQKVLDQMQLLEVTHQGALTKIAQEGESKRAELAKVSLSEFLKADDEKLKAGIAELQEEAAQGKISMGSRDQQEIQLTTTIRQEQIARVDAQLATLKSDTPQYEEMLKKRDQLEKQFTQDLKTENATRRKDMEAEARQWVTPFADGFKTAINDMIVHGKSFADSMTALVQGIEQGFISMCEQIAEKWLVTQVTNALVGQTTQATSAVAQVTSLSGVAGAAGVASTAAIPIVGPALAPAAGAAMAADALTYLGVASAAGGLVLDRDQLVFAHKNETVLPAPFSQGLQQMIASGGGGGGGDTHFHFNVGDIHAGSAPDLQQILREQDGVMRAWIAQKARDGAFRGR
jgi:hypothetical protein